MTIERSVKNGALKINVNLKPGSKQYPAAVTNQDEAESAAAPGDAVSSRLPRLSSLLSPNELDAFMENVPGSAYPSPFTAGMFESFKFDIPSTVEEVADTVEVNTEEDLSLFPLRDETCMEIEKIDEIKEELHEQENTTTTVQMLPYVCSETDNCDSAYRSYTEMLTLDEESISNDTNLSNSSFCSSSSNMAASEGAPCHPQINSGAAEKRAMYSKSGMKQRIKKEQPESPIARVQRCCRELGLNMDMRTWSRDEVDRWCWWVLRLFGVRGSLNLCLNGSDLCSLTKQDIEARMPQVGEYIYAELELWKNVHFLTCTGLNGLTAHSAEVTRSTTANDSAILAAAAAASGIAPTTCISGTVPTFLHSITSSSSLSTSSSSLLSSQGLIPLCVSTTDLTEIIPSSISEDFSSQLVASLVASSGELPHDQSDKFLQNFLSSLSTISSNNGHVLPDSTHGTISSSSHGVFVSQDLHSIVSHSNSESRFSNSNFSLTTMSSPARPKALPIPQVVLDQRAATPTTQAPSESNRYLSSTLDPILPLFLGGSLDTMSPGFGGLSNYSNNGSNFTSGSFDSSNSNSGNTRTGSLMDNYSILQNYRDLNDSRSANSSPYNSGSYSSSFDTGDDLSDGDCTTSDLSGYGNYRTRHSNHLWQFLKELLHQPNSYLNCIRWIDQEKGIFKIEDSGRVAKLWGQRKNRPAMNYDKLSRSIRQYYKKGIIKKTSQSKRLVYQFCV